MGRNASERSALQSLLRASIAVHQAAPAADRPDAYRMTRSLIAASQALEFDSSDIAQMLGVSERDLQSCGETLHPVLPSSFFALMPRLKPVAAAEGVWDPEPLEEIPTDPRELIAWYLSATS